MDVFDILLQAGLITSAIVAYLLVFRREPPKNGSYKVPGFYFNLKWLYARFAVYQWKNKLRRTDAIEWPRPVPYDKQGWDALSVRTTAPDGTTLLLGVRILHGRILLSEVNVHVKLPDGTSYVLPQHPESSVGTFEDYHHGWSADGLRFQVLEPQLRMRITYNGLLTRDDNTTQHVKINLIWTAASAVVRHPDDWSSELAAQALACETWRDGKWPLMLDQNNDGGWLQYGSVQGRFEAYDEEGVVDKSVYLQTRGLKERSWNPKGYKGLRRSVQITVASVDGTVVNLRCLSYKNVLTHWISGSIRHPGFSVESITSTDLVMDNFCETPAEIPNLYSIIVSSKKRVLKVILRINNDGGKMPSGVPYQHEVVYRTVDADIDGFAGSGILELGYEPAVVKDPVVRKNTPNIHKHISKMKAGQGEYCLTFEDRRAADSDLVGGKGASLALLASMQVEEGYKVPPGFCLSINALNKHLEQYPDIKAAILEIEAANENYEESYFKKKCEAASALFTTTEVFGDVKEEILVNMQELRVKATEQNLGPELRFAVRSSAVGEDSEVLSAAGQNETILGCVTDDDVLKAVLECWASMFAFTSAYYRRQNGQPCLCGGGVVVQALVTPRTAGVMFTRHPAHGDPSRLLVTANYGLGESVVSGAVEPDTFIIKRKDDQLSLSKTILGTKTQRITVKDKGVGLEEVPASERETACLTEGEVLRLARLGVKQEELWAAARDIEWAMTENEVFLLQARPITSLERWTEEELLHELDAPIMADNELISFGNTGEVVPRPLTPMSYDLISQPLTKGIDSVVNKTPATFDSSIAMTHCRLALQLFNTIYQKVPKEIDVNIRMIEMTIHGHSVADEEIMRAALHRRSPHWYDKVDQYLLLIKSLLSSKRCMNNTIKVANKLVVGEGITDPLELWNAISDIEESLVDMAHNHSVTSTASSCSQFIAMSVLMEGRSEFSPELCNEIGTLLSSGDVLSAEVPQGLASLARKLEASGRYEEFRALHPKEAMQWLKTNLPNVYQDVTKFLEQHGHRAIMEFDLSTKPWALVPEEMMKVLQSLQSTSETKHNTKTDEEIIASLKSPQNDTTRKILKWIMPLCRRTIRHREGTKAHLILAIHKVRLAFLRLGKAMVKQWYLPNEDLVFYFRLKELGSYIQNRDPALLRKASQRQQYYPSWCKLKFAEINQGWVTPLAAKGPVVSAGDVKIEAATVCGGEVVARACVVKDLSEIDQLRQGDVLITHATDIGWSPYFPLLTGIVTELGGLISHGAVIAREYGLPCIVGAADATDIFKTGDMVRLSGTKGTLERVVLENSEQNVESKNI